MTGVKLPLLFYGKDQQKKKKHNEDHEKSVPNRSKSSLNKKKA